MLTHLPPQLSPHTISQRKLTTLEEQHTSLSAAHKEKCHALDLTLAEAAKLDKEVAKLLGTVEKLESRCGFVYQRRVWGCW